MTNRHPRQRILKVLEDGALRWNDLKKLANLSDESLGYTLGELLDLRQIWTVEKNDVRIYGIERRLGLVPRYHHGNRRSTD